MIYRWNYEFLFIVEPISEWLDVRTLNLLPWPVLSPGSACGVRKPVAVYPELHLHADWLQYWPPDCSMDTNCSVSQKGNIFKNVICYQWLLCKLHVVLKFLSYLTNFRMQWVRNRPVALWMIPEFHKRLVMTSLTIPETLPWVSYMIQVNLFFHDFCNFYFDKLFVYYIFKNLLWVLFILWFNKDTKMVINDYDRCDRVQDYQYF